MAGGVHASSPGSATVTHQMGHSVLPPEYTLHSQTVLENGVSLNESNSSVENLESSTSRKRKLSTDAPNQLDSKRTCIYNHLLANMLIEKEKYLYISLLDKYGCGDENDFFNVIDKTKYTDPVLPFPCPVQPKSTYLSSEPEHLKSDLAACSTLKSVKAAIKQESSETVQSSQAEFSSRSSSTYPVVLIRPTNFRSSSHHAEGNSQQIAEKAKQEAYVLQRVADLQRSGLWTEKRLPKVQEPPRVKAHWDYVLEELEWLAQDFAQERKWKKAAARKRSRMVQKHFQEREALVHRAAKTAEINKRKVASHLAKMVKMFWNDVEKLLEFKQQTKLKEIRQQALDQHLSFIVDKTEKYSSLVAESMNKSSASTQDSNIIEKTSDTEFEPNQTSSDDEETIEAEEKGNAVDIIDHSKELEMLKHESELSLEDILNQLPEEYLNNIKETVKVNDKNHVEDEDDDDDSILDEKRRQISIDADDSLSIVKKYNAKSTDAMENSASSNAESSSESGAEDSDNEDSSISDEENTDDEEDLMSLLKDSKIENGDRSNENADENIDNVTAIAESLQPKGNTLSSTSVVTKVPFLLKHSLREYQHIGLDWLVTMYERNLNGILADEMGLGKTIQTIALLAHLASDKEDWGPHLIIVPTSVMLNWEMEFKKWCPAFKILTYYGSTKERKLKRSGWTKPNTFHVCITSYKLVLQDHHCFRRKKWKYLILDEAQNIKNFKSQRWQRLLHFDSERRLLLTGTPLQNNLMELWSLMHFLMPNLFASHREFKEWFSNPVTGMIEGNSEYNETIIKRLHKVLRPFLLRRLKTEVEKQLPSKYEHVIMCRLSNRQRYLYDDFMSRAKTKETLSSGNLLSVINILMQLRKVCNHPNLFEARPIKSPFQMENIIYHIPSLIDSALDYEPFKHVNLEAMNLQLLNSERNFSAWGAYRLRKLKVPRKLIEEIDDSPSEEPPIPKGQVNIRLKTPNDLSNIKLGNNARNSEKITSYFRTISSSVSASASQGSPAGTIGNTNSIPRVNTAPIFRTIIAQGEINNMAVKRMKPNDNSVPNKAGYTTLHVKAATTKTANTPQKIFIATSASKPILKTFTPIKNAQTIDSTSSIGSSPSNVVSSVVSTISTTSLSASITVPPGVVTASTSSAVVTGASTATLLASTPNSPSVSVRQLVQNSGKPIPKQLSTTGLKPATGQKVILKPGPDGPILASITPYLWKPNVQQNTILNNGPNINSTTSLPSSVILNNMQSKSIAIPKPISTLAISSSSGTNTVQSSTSATVTPRRTRSETKAIKEDLIVEAAEVIEKRKVTRKDKLRILSDINERKSSPYVMFGCDVRSTLKELDVNVVGDDEGQSMFSTDPHYWKCVGHVNCVNTQYAKHIHTLCSTLTNALSNSVKSIEERVQELSDTFSKYIVYVPAVNARRAALHVSHQNPSKSWSLSYMECVLEKELAPRCTYLHQITSRMNTSFPDSRLIQYDCGKLQTLDTLLRRLKMEQHRVLIFTQMARMLDVLEAFLTFHGHIYLRLDGSTRIDQRQILMERFNADKRYFCFILSTRSGGVGVNLTGADTVIFYDSDWNPTMDAQAQDRCHRIGQTRDVHIYRLISAKTIEENILKKANQKRLLGDIAIEGGNFTTAFFKSGTIHDLFNVDLDENDPAKRMNDLMSDNANSQTIEKPMLTATSSDANSQNIEKSTLTAYESALAAVEDETDVKAAHTAKEEAVADLAEFDENIPLIENESNMDTSIPEELSKAEQKVNALLEELKPIERWALRFMETVDAEWAEEQLAAAEAEIEQQKKEWEMERQAIEKADERSKRMDEEMEEEDMQLVYSSKDSKNQVNDISNTRKKLRKKVVKTRTARGSPPQKSAADTSDVENGDVVSSRTPRRAQALGISKYKRKLRGSGGGDGSGAGGDTNNVAASRSSPNVSICKAEVMSVKVEAVRLEHLHLVGDKSADSALIAKSLAQIKRRSMKDTSE